MNFRQAILRVAPFPLLGGLFLSTALGQAAVIRGGWLFDGTGDARVRNPGIVIQSGKILAVGEAGGGWDISQVITVEDSQTILPGFIDLHAHYAVDFFAKGRVDETEVYPALFLANGVTSTFPAGEIDPVKMRRLRIDIGQGRRIGPRLLNSGPYFGAARYGWDGKLTPAQIEAEVDHWAAQGVSGFKAKNITAPHLKALLQAAHRHGLTVTAHLNSGVGGSVNPRHAIRMGIDRIEHFLGGEALSPDRHAYQSWKDVDVASEEFKSIARLYIKQRVYFDATIAAFGSFGAVESPVFEDFADERQYLTPYLRGRTGERPKDGFTQTAAAMYEAKKRTIKAFFEAGGGDLITLGTDHPSWGVYLTPFYVHREMQAMVSAGLPCSAVLRIATLNGARALGLAQQLGSIEAGKWADLVVVDGNPLSDITATRNVAWSMKSGQRYNAADLLSQSKDRLGPAQESEEQDWQQPSASEPVEAAASQAAEALVQSWECRNDIEVSCLQGDCKAKMGEDFTPMSVAFDDSGAMSVCAYSGCWEGTGMAVQSGEFLVIIGHQLKFSTSPDSESSKADIVLAIDRGDRIATIKAGQFAHPLRCRRAE